MKNKFYHRPFFIFALSLFALSIPPILLHFSGDAGFGVIFFVFSGELFEPRRVLTGGALDQPSLHKIFFIFCYSISITLPCLAGVRLIKKHNSRPFRFIFSAISSVILLHPFSVLTAFTYAVSHYIYHMGVTPKRCMALAVSLILYALLTYFLIWIWRNKSPAIKSSQSQSN